MSQANRNLIGTNRISGATWISFRGGGVRALGAGPQVLRAPVSPEIGPLLTSA